MVKAVKSISQTAHRKPVALGVRITVHSSEVRVQLTLPSISAGLRTGPQVRGRRQSVEGATGEAEAGKRHV